MAARSFTYDFTARDKFAAVADRVASSTEGVVAKTKRLGQVATTTRARIKKLSASLKRTGDGMKSFGRGLSLGVSAPALAFGVASVMAFDKQAKAQADVRNAIEKTGGAAGLSFEQMAKAASDLQKNSLFGDEVILKEATSQLLTFTNITGDEFLRAQVMAADLSAKIGAEGLQGAAIMLGKALNDPKVGLMSLSKVGVSFTESQKSVILGLASVGRHAEAQAFLLDVLEEQYGGTAAAAAKAGLGPIQQLGMRFGDISETIGKQLLVVLDPLIVMLGDVATFFEGLSPRAQKFIGIAVALAVVLGPMVFAFGMLITALPFVIAGFGALAPIAATLGVSVMGLSLGVLLIPLAIMAAIAAVWLLYENWDAVWSGIAKYIAVAVDGVEKFATVAGGALGAVGSFLGIGNSDDMAVSATSETNVNLRVSADPGTKVRDLQTKTTGAMTGRVGVAMAGA